MNPEHLTTNRKRHLSFASRIVATGLNVVLLLSALAIPLNTALANTNASEWNTNDEARTRLLTPFGLEKDGRTVWIGLEIDLEPGWHSYWKNPGDAGLPPSFPEFDDEYISKLEINFPPPKFYPFGGGLDANGYANGVIYPVRLTLTDKALKSDRIPLNLGLFYLVCKDLCIPHDASFSTELILKREGSTDSKAPYADKMRKALSLLPKSPQEVPEAELRESLTQEGENYLLTIAFRSPVGAENFPSIFFHQTPTLKLGAPQFSVGKDKRDLIITVVTTPVQTKVAGAVLDTITIGYLLTEIPTDDGIISIEKVAHLKVGDKSIADPGAAVGASGSSGNGAEFPKSDISLLEMLFFAFLGGLILNIMPCVLPVLSIKLMSILGHGGDSRSGITRSMLLSSGGIITSFLILAAAAVIAKNAGAAIGWGVQFQEPAFVSFLAIVVFLFGLNLWGVFEVTLPSSVSTGAAKASQRGHFTQGMLATLLATPCSAPFLGSAVGFAFASPAPIVFGIFFALGLGMSAPYLTLALFPKAVRFLPKPGDWMEKAKGFFGFLLMATVIWLMFVLAGQIDAISQALVWLGLLLLALIIWGKRAFSPYSDFFSSIGGLLTVALVVGASVLTMNWAIDGRLSMEENTAKVISDSEIHWKPFSQDAIEQGLKEGKVVFVDVTADWCWTCKINDELFIETDEVISLLNADNVLALQADWTNRSQEIGDFLAHYGRSGIPFYIAFYGGDVNNYITLPVTITKGTVVDALQTAISKNTALSGL